MIKILTRIALIVFITIFLGGCYSDTVNSLSTFKFQLPIHSRQLYQYKTSPDTSKDFSNLNQYKDYTDNKEKIKRADIILFNYWIDSLIINGYVFNPLDPNNDYYYNYTTHTAPEGKKILQFDFIRFYMVFASPASYPVSSDPYDPRNWTFDASSKWYLLGEFQNPNIAEYYRLPGNIITVKQDVMNEISDAIKVRPQFFIMTEYGNTVGGEKFFDLVKSGFDLIIEFEVSL